MNYLEYKVLNAKGITIKEASSKKELKTFIKFPSKLYANCKYYVPPFVVGEMDTLQPEKNPAYEFCKAKYWLAYKNEQVVGRIAGIINFNYNKYHKTNYVRFGWLDFIEDEAVLQSLLKTVEEWGKHEKMDVIHGPLGFNSFDASGIQVEGFDEMPTSFAHYNFPYYPRLIEKQGYEKDVDWVEFRVKMPTKIPEKIARGAKAIQERYQLYRPELKNTKELLQYADQLFEVLNESYEGLYAFSKLTERQIDNLKKQFVPFINPKYTSIVLDKENKLVAFGISMPSLSKALIKSKGKLFPLGFLRIWKALRKNDTADLLLIGVKPSFQRKGAPALLFEKIGNTFLKNNIKYLETTRQLEYNNSVKQLFSNFEIRQHKRSRCYIKKLNYE